MPTIHNITAREIIDSRGNPTVEVELVAGKVAGGKARTIHTLASVPSGASTGRHEALELRDGGKRFLGLGVEKAIRNVETVIAPALKGIDCREQEKIDRIMLKLDGTPHKRKLGANAILAVSLVCARAAALAEKKELYQYIDKLAKVNRKPILPRPFFNIINGGKHAGTDLPFQEFMIAPRGKNVAESLRMGSEVYHVLKRILAENYGKTAINVGDEGGFAPPIKTAEEALELLKEASAKAGYKGQVDLAMDCAASEFYKNGAYYLPQKIAKERLLNYYLKLIKKYKIISLEDPLEQEDFQSFAELREKTNIQIVGDDLTVTNVGRIRKAIKEKSCNCLLLKVNQIGTLTESLEAVRLAYSAGWKVMVSHRSGETEDTFIADLAVGIGCGMIKAGAPCRGERTAKYNRLVRIEENV